MTRRADIVTKLKAALDRARFEHSLRVEKMAVRLARNWGVSVKLASQAALLHDCAKQGDQGALTHAAESARLARRRYGVGNSSVLKAIRRHTLGSPRMTKLEKIIYLSDKLELGRKYPGVKSLRLLAFKDLDRAVGQSADWTLQYLLTRGHVVDKRTVRTRDYYLK